MDTMEEYKKKTCVTKEECEKEVRDAIKESEKKVKDLTAKNAEGNARLQVQW